MHNFRSLSGRSLLHALFLASALLLAGGILSLIAPPMATAQTAPAFTSDRLSVEVLGSGPDVILIPGMASSREVWRAEALRLASTHRVHMVQLAGFGGEPWTHGEGAFIQPVIDELVRYISVQGLDRPSVIGHSMGGLIGLVMAEQHPEAVSRIMSVDSLPFFSVLMAGETVTAESARPFADRMTRSMVDVSDEDFRAAQTQLSVGTTRNPDTQAAIVEWSMASDRLAMGVALRDVMLTDARPGLSGMTTPVWAVYAADADGGVSPEDADALWGREYTPLPGVTLIRVDDSRHFIMADQPERFAAIVDRFLAD